MSCLLFSLFFLFFNTLPAMGSDTLDDSEEKWEIQGIFLHQYIVTLCAKNTKTSQEKTTFVNCFDVLNESVRQGSFSDPKRLIPFSASCEFTLTDFQKIQKLRDLAVFILGKRILNKDPQSKFYFSLLSQL